MHASRILTLSLALFGCLVLMLSPVSAIAQTPSAVDTELERVRGNWRVVELVENGIISVIKQIFSLHSGTHSERRAGMSKG